MSRDGVFTGVDGNLYRNVNGRIERVVDYSKYKVVDGIYYNPETDDAMIALLEDLRRRDVRVRFHWGDTKTGEDWGDVYGVEGTIRCSMGPIKVPLLVNNIRSTGGDPILTHCIVKIEHANKRDGGVIYEHPNYHAKG